MKIVTVTDTCLPQVNGVARTIEATHRALLRAGHRSVVLGPQEFAGIGCPGYPGLRLALWPRRALARRLAEQFDDDDEVALHVATEGPLGWAARHWSRAQGIAFTSAYHTRFPQYLRAMYRVPEAWTYATLRRFHRAAAAVLAPTARIEDELRGHGFGRIGRWTRGVDIDGFRPMPRADVPWPRPVFLYVGRVSVEKNLDAFLRLDLPGSKVVAGVGPALAALKRRYPAAHFIGVLDRDALARLYSAADAFVFPSRTDTFGLVLLEALACGTPVAAFPVPGPLDVIGDAPVGVLDEDLQWAALAALAIDRERCREFALGQSWDHATRQFLALQVPRAAGGRRRQLRSATAKTSEST